MSKYIPFTTEQKERAASVDLEEFLRRRGEKLITSGRDKRLASDHSITCLLYTSAKPPLRPSLSARPKPLLRKRRSVSQSLRQSR